MKIYTIGYSNKFDSYHTDTKIGYTGMKAMKGVSSLWEDWECLQLNLYEENKEKAELGYIWNYINSAVVVTKNVKELLETKFATDDFEFLNAKYLDVPMYIMHCINPYPLKADFKFDMDKIEASFELDDIKKYNIKDKGLFKVINDKGWVSPLLFTDTFVEYITEKGFDSIRFIEIGE